MSTIMTLLYRYKINKTHMRKRDITTNSKRSKNGYIYRSKYCHECVNGGKTGLSTGGKMGWPPHWTVFISMSIDTNYFCFVLN